jgi:outer membrane protein assembly factor BamA
LILKDFKEGVVPLTLNSRLSTLIQLPCLLSVCAVAVAQSLPSPSLSSSIDSIGIIDSIDNIDTSSITSSGIDSIDISSALSPSIDSTDTSSTLSSGINNIDNTDTSSTLQQKNQDIKYIRGIEIYGNVTTRPEILRYCFAFDTGEVLDTAKLRLTRASLLATQLYEKVDIFPHMREDGAHIFIILKEAVRLDLGYGVRYSTRKYGEKVIWYSAQFNAALNNFRGRMETFWFGVNAWDHLALDLYWHKPFLPTLYYATLSAGISGYPDDALPVNYTDVYGKLAVGRKVLKNSRVFVSAMPVYKHRTILEAGSRWSDTVIIAHRDTSDFLEAFAGTGVVTDRRSARFDPKSGWFMSLQLGTNRLYNGVNDPFFQSTSEFRYYLSLLNDVTSFRLLLTLRDSDAGTYHRLSYGGAGEVRGYANQELGWNFSAQSSILASVKYNKPLYTTPELPIPLVDILFTGVRNLVFRIDATLIADAAMLYKEPQGALTQRGQTQSGLAFGFGTRILAPKIRQSGCIDLVFGRTAAEDGGYDWEPALHVYLDFFY